MAGPINFYNDLITAKSWQTLQSLKKQVDFVLIGGWAVWLYTKSLKSKDIDIIVNYDQLEKLKRAYLLTKNDRLTKYEARNEEVQIDVYLPHYSQLGIPAEEIIKHVTLRETFSLPTVEMLIVLKLFVYKQRHLSAKGQKDRLDLLSLLITTKINFPVLEQLLKTAHLENLKTDLHQIISQTAAIPELGITNHSWSRMKKTFRT